MVVQSVASKRLAWVTAGCVKGIWRISDTDDAKLAMGPGGDWG